MCWTLHLQCEEGCWLRESTCVRAGTVELCNLLSSALGIDVVPTVLVDYPTLTALASHLAGAMPPTALARLAGAPSSMVLLTADGPIQGNSAPQSPLSFLKPADLPVLTVAGISAAMPGGKDIVPVARDAPTGAELTIM